MKRKKRNGEDMAGNKTVNHTKIVAAAKKEFLTYGFADASMRRIAAAAGMSAAGLYKHFPSKEDMFGSLVDPVLEEFWKRYKKSEDEIFEGIPTSEPSDMLAEGNNATSDIIEFIYDNYDEFKLLICGSKGTRYANIVNEITAVEEKVTLQYLEELKKNNIHVNEYRPEEVHILIDMMVDAVFQPLKHDFDREQAVHFAQTIDRFMGQGWKDFYGFD